MNLNYTISFYVDLNYSTGISSVQKFDFMGKCWENFKSLMDYYYMNSFFVEIYV